jgi:hypothetical protein
MDKILPDLNKLNPNITRYEIIAQPCLGDINLHGRKVRSPFQTTHFKGDYYEHFSRIADCHTNAACTAKSAPGSACNTDRDKTRSHSHGECEHAFWNRRQRQ